jgi:hypothetical protein
MKIKRIPMWPLIILLFLIMLLNGAALYWHLYYFIWWLDIPMHFLGGLWVALFSLAWLFRSPYVGSNERSPFFVWMFALAVTLLVGLVWELFEFNLSTIVGFSERDLGDTLLDLVMDVAGAVSGTVFFLKMGYNRSDE